jgi:hypothetical protein
MHCEYTVAYNDFLESMKAYRKVSRQAAIGYVLYVWIIPIACFATAIFCIMWSYRHDSQIGGTYFWIACIALGITFGLPARYRIAMRRAFKLRNILARDRPMSCEFDDARIRFIVPGGTEVSYPWESFTNYFENAKVAVLFVGQAAFHTIPKGAMEEGGWAKLRELVNQHARKI